MGISRTKMSHEIYFGLATTQNCQTKRGAFFFFFFLNHSRRRADLLCVDLSQLVHGVDAGLQEAVFVALHLDGPQPLTHGSARGQGLRCTLVQQGVGRPGGGVTETKEGLRNGVIETLLQKRPAATFQSAGPRSKSEAR